jgi:hypothetical protein
MAFSHSRFSNIEKAGVATVILSVLVLVYVVYAVLSG